MEYVDVSKLLKDISLSDQEKDPDLSNSIKKLHTRMEESDIPGLKQKKIWMINSTATGGGVAEMLPRIIYTLRTFGLNIEWLVITANETPEFFNITKKLHNFIHGQNPSNVTVGFTEEEKKIFEQVNYQNANDFVTNYLKKGDIVMVHDPQPICLVQAIRKKYNSKEVPCFWRCHIGYDETTKETTAAWNFLEPYVRQYDLTVFSAKEYVPKFAPNPRIVYPSLHPLDYKNRYLSFFDIKDVLGKAGLFTLNEKYLDEDEKYPYKIKMLRSDNNFVVPADDPDLSQFGFLDRPLILQISRWDRLKGWTELVEAFADIKSNPEKYVDSNDPNSKDHLRFIKRMGLVLAGPDSSKIADDPEGLEVLQSLVDQINSYPPEINSSIALLSLPLDSRWQNALIVNCLQRLAAIVIQNSLREGFGLTLLEAMWKQRPCIASSACGLRQQLRPSIDGLMVSDPNSSKSVAQTINEMIKVGDEKRQEFARNAKKRSIDNFLVYEQVKNYLNCIKDITH